MVCSVVDIGLGLVASSVAVLVPEDEGIWMLEVEEIPGSFIHLVDI